MMGYPSTYSRPRGSRVGRALGRESFVRRFDWVLFASAITLSIVGALLVMFLMGMGGRRRVLS